jgi:hypothetical protein
MPNANAAAYMPFLLVFLQSATISIDVSKIGISDIQAYKYICTTVVTYHLTKLLLQNGVGKLKP